MSFLSWPRHFMSQEKTLVNTSCMIPKTSFLSSDSYCVRIKHLTILRFLKMSFKKYFFNYKEMLLKTQADCQPSLIFNNTLERGKAKKAMEIRSMMLDVRLMSKMLFFGSSWQNLILFIQLFFLPHVNVKIYVLISWNTEERF